MINLKIPRKYIRIRDRLKLLFGLTDGIHMNFPNITLDPGESIIIHSPAGAETSVAVKVQPDRATLRVLFSPPSIDLDCVDVLQGGMKADKSFKKKMRLGKNGTRRNSKS